MTLEGICFRQLGGITLLKQSALDPFHHLQWLLNDRIADQSCQDQFELGTFRNAALPARILTTTPSG